MRYQELLVSASVLGAAIALHNCRHPGNMHFGLSIFQPGSCALCHEPLPPARVTLARKKETWAYLKVASLPACRSSRRGARSPEPSGPLTRLSQSCSNAETAACFVQRSGETNFRVRNC